jgi:ribulose-phosphate 3-epimerase
VLKKIKEGGMKSGVAVKPKTPVSAVFPFVDAGLVDMILVMTVEPGFGGQSFMADMMPKVKEARDKYPSIDIQVDGGLAPSTIDEAAQNGANVIVAGSSVYGAKDPEGVIRYLREAVLKQQAAK